MKGVMSALLLAAVFLIMPASVQAEANYLGEKECYACHKDIKKVYLENRHGKVFTRNPKNDLQARGCEACHGAGGEHKAAADRLDKGEKVPLEIEGFKRGAENVSGMNGRCLTCHEKGARTHWRGSSHEREELGCVDCHTIHAEGRIDGTEVCLRCHVERRAQLQRSSHLPLREGKVKCSSCHNPHGSLGPSLLKTASINENCYSCHQEKRGPLLWEHAPVRENCTNCHNPHGSNYEALLKMKVPYLCKSCHMEQYHPSSLYDGSQVIAGGGNDRHTIGRGCLNCHPQVHGSNHPSGARMQR